MSICWYKELKVDNERENMKKKRKILHVKLILKKKDVKDGKWDEEETIDEWRHGNVT